MDFPGHRAPRMGALIQIHPRDQRVSAAEARNPWDKRLVEAAAKNLPPLISISKSSQARRHRVAKIVALLRRVCTSVGRLLATLAAVFSPSTALSYGVTVGALFPRVKKDPEYASGILALKQANARAQARQSVPVTPVEMRRLLASTPAGPVRTIFLAQWLQAGRYGDLQHAIVRRIWFSSPPIPVEGVIVIRLDYPVWKSDRTGARHCSKTFVVPSAEGLQLRDMIHGRRLPSYPVMLAALRRVLPHLGMHSLRRGAVHELTEAGVPPEQTVLLTQHAMPGEPLALRNYIPPSPYGVEASTQIRLSLRLLQMVL